MEDPIPGPAGAAETGYVPVADAGVSASPAEYATLDTAISFSAGLASSNQWPAIDPLTSRSTYLDDGAGDRHRRLAAAAREVLASTDAANEDCRSRLCAFLAQPLAVGESHSGIPGVYVSLADTLSDVEEILRQSAMPTSSHN